MISRYGDVVIDMFREKRDKTDIYWGSHHGHVFVFLTSLLIFVPCLEVILFINHYFLVCIRKYCTSTRGFFKFYYNFELDM